MLKVLLASAATSLLGLTRYQKRLGLVVFDLVLLHFCLWFAMSLRLGFLYLAPTWDVFFLLAATPTLAVAALFRVGLYRHVTRHFGSQGTRLIAMCVALSSLCLGLGAFLLQVEGIPRTVLFVYPVFGTLALWGFRRALGQLITQSGIALPPPADPRAIRNVIIYGVSAQGEALFHAIRRSRDLAVTAFVDPDPTLWRQYVHGVRIHAPQQLPNLVRSQGVAEVLLALDGAARADRLLALRWLKECPVDVRLLPPMEDLASGRVLSDLRRVEAEDLLMRQPIAPNPALLAQNIRGKSVLVTGAGGSIGSELVRQVLANAPRRLVMLDASETNLHGIELHTQRMRQKGAHAAETVAVLGSVLDDNLLQAALREHGIETIYHAAAFKHLGMLEQNPIVGVRNNVIGTEAVLRAAEDCGVETLVLISTDKAVRPTSILGSSKRAAEMLLQAHAASGTARTTLAIVRFGNVLDSSGSAVQLFREQIRQGGPVTVTDPEAARYFISIPEAAQLVIQAGAMAKGGEVFALDMGEPVKILDLARMMIQLSGRRPRDAEHKDGDIEIVFTGLRRGEKLLEELPPPERTAPTQHPRIVRTDEPYLPEPVLAKHLRELRDALDRNDAEATRGILVRLLAACAEPVQRQPDGSDQVAAGQGGPAKVGMRAPMR